MRILFVAVVLDTERPSRPVPPGASMPVIDVPGEEVPPASETRLRAAAPHAGLVDWLDRQARRVGR